MKTINHIWSMQESIAQTQKYINDYANIFLFFSPSIILTVLGKFDLWHGTKLLLTIMWETFLAHPFTAIFRIMIYPILLPFFAMMTLPIHFFFNQNIESSIFQGLSAFQAAAAVILLPICYLFFNEYKNTERVNNDTVRGLFFKFFNKHELTYNEYNKLLNFVTNYTTLFPQSGPTNEQTVNDIILHILGSHDAELLAAVSKTCAKDSDLFYKLEQAAAQCHPWPLDDANCLLWHAAKQIRGEKLQTRIVKVDGKEKRFVSEVYVDPTSSNAAPEALEYLQALVNRAAPFYRT
tara:strand:+ start:51292 stop:52170 length:879 start_codon:yes stop_codon:yes gene_type:complete